MHINLIEDTDSCTVYPWTCWKITWMTIKETTRCIHEAKTGNLLA